MSSVLQDGVIPARRVLGTVVTSTEMTLTAMAVGGRCPVLLTTVTRDSGGDGSDGLTVA